MEEAKREARISEVGGRKWTKVGFRNVGPSVKKMSIGYF